MGGRFESRVVFSTVGAVMLVAVVVVAGVARPYAVGFTDDLRQRTPSVAQTSGKLVPDVTDRKDRVVRTFHGGADRNREPRNRDRRDRGLWQAYSAARPEVTNVDPPDYTEGDILDGYGLEGNWAPGRANGGRLARRFSSGPGTAAVHSIRTRRYGSC